MPRRDCRCRNPRRRFSSPDLRPVARGKIGAVGHQPEPGIVAVAPGEHVKQTVAALFQRPTAEVMACQSEADGQAGGQDAGGRFGRQHNDQDEGGEADPGCDPGAVRGEPERAEDQRAPGEAFAHQHGFGVRLQMRGVEFHSAPFVDGMASPMRGSGSAAMRKARAAALKHASATWWALWPARRVTCKVTMALNARARKNSSNSSVSMSPILGRSKATFQARNGRPEMSTAASARVSSIGIEAWPNRLMPRLSPKASFKAVPRTMPTSSVVWWKSICRSPVARIERSNRP